MKNILVFAAFFLLACGDDGGKANNQNNVNNSNNTNNVNNENNLNNVNNVNNSNNVNNINNLNNVNPADITFLVSTVSSDFSSSRYAWVSVTLGEEITATVEAADFGVGDVAVAAGNERAYVIDRGAFPDNDGTVRVFDYDGNQLDEFAAPGNPKDAVFANGNSFVSLYNTGELLVHDGAGTNTIDLSAFDGDQNPELDAMALDGDYLLVVMQKLTNFAGVEDSCVAVVDTTTQTIVDQDPITDFDDATCLVIKNAWAGIQPLTDTSWAVGAIGDFGVQDSGLVEIRSPDSDGLYTSTPMFVSEPELGGDIYDFTFTMDGFGLVAVDDAGAPALKLIDSRTTATWQISDAPFSIGDTSGAAIDSAGEYAVVGVRDAAEPKFLLLDNEANIVLEIPVEYQPYDVAFAKVP